MDVEWGYGANNGKQEEFSIVVIIVFYCERVKVKERTK
jgi:hypothetical protein